MSPTAETADGTTAPERTALGDILWPIRPIDFGLPNAADQWKVFLDSVERSGFKKLVFAVAASGFFTDSYNLFVTNGFLPALAFIYWPSDDPWREIALNAVTLGGAAVGQVVFGFLADIYGRRSLYGVELIIVIISTVCLLQSSEGYTSPPTPAHPNGLPAMSITGWLLFSRIFMGLGIGAEYPLSACIAAEWSSTRTRPQMMALVFLMQPLGQFCSYWVGLAALKGLTLFYDFSATDGEAKVGIDVYWRIVVGVGALPTLVALIFRLTIPESGRFTFEVRKNLSKAIQDTEKVYKNTPGQSTDGMEMQAHANAANRLAYSRPSLRHKSTQRMTMHEDGISDLHSRHESDRESETGISNAMDDDTFDLNLPPETTNQFTWPNLHEYLFEAGNWRYLAGTSLCWAALDFVFYGLGFNNPGTLAKLWTSHRMPSPPDAGSWLISSSVSDRPGVNIYDVLYSNAVESILTVSVASIAGTICMVLLIDAWDRRNVLIASFLVLAVLLLGTGVAFPYAFHTGASPVLILLWAIIQACFSFGPNTLTFLIPAEIFPTRFRCFFYGISAASGKIGSVLVQVAFLKFQGGSIQQPNSSSIRWMLILFAALMLLGAFVAWVWIPGVQVRELQPPHRLRTRSLEELSDGMRRKDIAWAEQVGVRRKFEVMRRRITKQPFD